MTTAAKIKDDVTPSSERTYAVSFDEGRLGRVREFADQQVVIAVTADTTAADELAGAIFRLARKSLISSWFDVTVELTDDEASGRFSIESGRFGSGRVELVESS